MNETINNETLNTTAQATNNTSGFWKPFEPSEIPDFGSIIDRGAQECMNRLIEWGFDPFRTLFTAFLGLVVVLLLYYIFVRSTSGSSWIFKPIAYILVLFFILLALGLI